MGAHGARQVEDFGRKLAHQFPWVPAAYVAVGLALRRRFLSDPEAPSTIARRRQITKARTPCALGSSGWHEPTDCIGCFCEGSAKQCTDLVLPGAKGTLIAFFSPNVGSICTTPTPPYPV